MNSIEEWRNFSNKKTFGRVICDFKSTNHVYHLTANFGDLVRIHEECEEWYRCRLIRNENDQLGLIPKNYIKIISLPDTEITEEFYIKKFQNKIWITLQKVIDSLFVQKKIINFKKLIGKIYFLLKFSTQLDEKDTNASRNMMLAVELLNNLCRKFYFEPCRYIHGAFFDAEEFTFPSVFFSYKFERTEDTDTANFSEDLLNSSTNKFSNLKKISHPFHFLIKLQRIEFQQKGSYLIEIAMVEKSTMKFISENYIYQIDLEKDCIILNEENPVIFTNFLIGDLTNGVLLLIKVFEKRKFFNEKELSHSNLKVFVGLTAINLKEFNHKNETDFKTFKLPIIPAEKNTKQNIEELIIDLINNKPSENYSNNIELSIKKYNKSLLLLNSGFLDSIEENNLKIKCIIPKNYLNDDVDINEYYLTLESADFRNFNKGGQYLIESVITLRDCDGNLVKNSMLMKSNQGEVKLDYFNFSIVFDCELPYWNEMIRFIMPKNNIENYLLCIVFKRYIAKNNNIRPKGKNNFAWCIVRFCRENTHSIETGDLKLKYFTMNFKNQDITKQIDETMDGDKEFVKMISTFTKDQCENSKEIIFANARIFSNRHTENENISQIINFKKSGIEISNSTLKNVSYADFFELKTFYKKLITIGMNIFDKYTSSESYKSYLVFMTSIIALSKYFDNDDLIKNHRKSLTERVKKDFFKKFIERNMAFLEEIKTDKFQFKQVIGSMMEWSIYLVKIFKPDISENQSNENSLIFSKMIKNFFGHFNNLINESFTESEASILKYIVICPELVMTLQNLLKSEDLNEILESICELENSIDINPKKMKTYNSFLKITDNYLNTLIAIFITGKKDLLEYAIEWVLTKIKLVLTKISLDDAAVDVLVKIAEIVEFSAKIKEINYKQLPVLRMIENFSVFCLEEINNDSWNAQSLKIFGLYFSLFNIIDDTAFSEFLSEDYGNEFGSSHDILRIFTYFTQSCIDYRISIYVLDNCSKIIHKCIEKMFRFVVKIHDKDECYSIFIQRLFDSSFKIIKMLVEDESNLFYMILSRNYTNKNNSIVDHIRTSHDIYLLDAKLKSNIINEVSTIISFVLCQELNENDFEIIYDFLINSCAGVCHIEKLMDKIYAYIEKNIDKMGASVNKLYTLIQRILTRVNESENMVFKPHLITCFSDLEKLVKTLCNCLLKSETANNSLFKLIRYQSIIKVSQELQLNDFTRSVIVRMKEENEKLGSYSEAAKIIRILLSPDEISPLQVEASCFRSKEEEYFRHAIDLDEKSSNYYFAIKDSKLLINHYELNGFPCDKISQTYYKMANFSNLLNSFDSSSYSFFFVKFYGNKFPKFIREHKYIFNLGYNVKLGDAISYITNRVDFAKIINQPGGQKEKIKEGNYIRVLSVIPKKNKPAENNSSENQKIAYENTVTKFSARKLKAHDKDDLEKNLMRSVTYEIEFPLPSHVPFGEIIAKKTKILTEVDQSILNIKSSIDDLKSIIQNYLKDKKTFKMLIMKIQGNMLAKVNGGIELYVEKYYGENYFLINKSEKKKSPKLKEIIEEFMKTNSEAIALSLDTLSSDLIPLFKEIILNYDATRDLLKKYAINCPVMPVFVHSDNYSIGSSVSELSKSKNSTFFWSRKANQKGLPKRESMKDLADKFENIES